MSTRPFVAVPTTEPEPAEEPRDAVPATGRPRRAISPDITVSRSIDERRELAAQNRARTAAATAQPQRVPPPGTVGDTGLTPSEQAIFQGASAGFASGGRQQEFTPGALGTEPQSGVFDFVENPGVGTGALAALDVAGTVPIPLPRISRLFRARVARAAGNPDDRIRAGQDFFQAYSSNLQRQQQIPREEALQRTEQALRAEGYTDSEIGQIRNTYDIASGRIMGQRTSQTLLQRDLDESATPAARVEAASDFIRLRRNFSESQDPASGTRVTQNREAIDREIQTDLINAGLSEDEVPQAFARANAQRGGTSPRVNPNTQAQSQRQAPAQSQVPDPLSPDAAPSPTNLSGRGFGAVENPLGAPDDREQDPTDAIGGDSGQSPPASSGVGRTTTTNPQTGTGRGQGVGPSGGVAAGTGGGQGAGTGAGSGAGVGGGAAGVGTGTGTGTGSGSGSGAGVGTGPGTGRGNGSGTGRQPGGRVTGRIRPPSGDLRRQRLDNLRQQAAQNRARNGFPDLIRWDSSSDNIENEVDPQTGTHVRRIRDTRNPRNVRSVGRTSQPPIRNNISAGRLNFQFARGRTRVRSIPRGRRRSSAPRRRDEVTGVPGTQSQVVIGS